jgi:ABC-type dipeptide/oligopeptide/nickel transport system permease subunit
LKIEENTNNYAKINVNFKLKEIVKTVVKNKMSLISLVVLMIIVFIVIFGNFLTPYNPTEQSRTQIHQKISINHWFGTDEHGRDILSRILAATKLSVISGILCVLFSFAFGIVLGATAGYYEGKIDSLIMRFMDILLSLPSILLAITIMCILGRGFEKAILAIGIVNIPDYAMIVRGSILSEKQSDYVQASRVIGAKDSYIIFKSILPNVISSLIVRATLGISDAILSAAAIGFLGLGAQPPVAEWGDMLGRSRSYMFIYPHEAFFPGVAIFITVLAFNFLGDGLRDALDPKSREI